jgi:hypothetical protein
LIARNAERGAAPESASARLIAVIGGGAIPLRPVREQTKLTGPEPQGVSAMDEATKTQSRARLTLNSDGQRHPMENSFTIFVFLAGLLAFSIGFIVRLHFPGTVLGLGAFVIGLYAQMISVTREQRVLIMAGMIAAFVGAGLSIAHGGFSLTA